MTPDTAFAIALLLLLTMVVLATSAIVWMIWYVCQDQEGDKVPKTPWEDRVRMLLENLDIPYYYKAPDGAGYGGKPRIDFQACDILGRFLLIEVKSVDDKALSFSPKTLVPPVQDAQLTAVGESAKGCAILAVGVGDHTLVLYNWMKIRLAGRVSLLGDAEFAQLAWRGPKEWRAHSMYGLLAKHWTYEDGMFSKVKAAGLPPTTAPTAKPTIRAKSLEEVLESEEVMKAAALKSPAKIIEEQKKIWAEEEERLQKVLKPTAQERKQARDFLKNQLLKRAVVVSGSESGIEMMPTNSGEASPPAEPSPSTSRRADSVTMRRKAKLLEQRSLQRKARNSS